MEGKTKFRFLVHISHLEQKEGPLLVMVFITLTDINMFNDFFSTTISCNAMP